MRFLPLAVSFMCAVGVAACQEATPLAEVCATTGNGRVRAGDANGDGVIDIADALVVYRSVADGGPAPACPLASDLVVDDRLNYDDAHSLLIHLFEDGFTLPDVAPVDCPEADALETPACVQAAVGFEVDGDTVTVTVDPGTVSVEAWSLGVRADGCTLLSATTEGTQAAWQVDGGRRDIGYDATFVSADGASAVSAVVLDFADATALVPGAGPQAVLRLVTSGGACTLTVTDDEKAQRSWPKVRSALAVGTGSFPVAGASVVVGP